MKSNIIKDENTGALIPIELSKTPDFSLIINKKAKIPLNKSNKEIINLNNEIIETVNEDDDFIFDISDLTNYEEYSQTNLIKKLNFNTFSILNDINDKIQYFFHYNKNTDYIEEIGIHFNKIKNYIDLNNNYDCISLIICYNKIKNKINYYFINSNIKCLSKISLQDYFNYINSFSNKNKKINNSYLTFKKLRDTIKRFDIFIIYLRKILNDNKKEINNLDFILNYIKNLIISKTNFNKFNFLPVENENDYKIIKKLINND